MVRSGECALTSRVDNPLVIVGPTASGKSSLALAIAQSTPGAEIVSADAMAIYAGMDVGTAKATVEERATVPHHLVDVVSSSDDYTVGQFAADVDAVMGRLAETPVVLVGGTGLYVQSVVDDFTFPGTYPDVMAALEEEPDTESLWRRLNGLDPAGAAKMEPTNRRRILRALEVCVGSGQPFSTFGPGVDAYPPTRFVLAGLEIDREVLDRRIDERYEAQMEAGFLDEVRALRDADAMGRTARQALGYRELLAHLDGEMSLGDALDEAKRRTKRFARRQQRWFRRDPRIVWLDAMASDLVDQAVAVWDAGPAGPTLDSKSESK